MLSSVVLLALCATQAPLVTAALDCPDGFEDPGLDNFRCYMFSNESQTWTNAFVACLTAAEDGSLLSLPAATDFYPMSYLVRQGGVDQWTGLLELPGGVRQWADETPYDPDLDKFFAAEAAAAATAGDAPHANFGYLSGSDGLFHVADGDEERGYACYVDLTPPPTVPTTTVPTTTPSTPAPPPCDDGYQLYDGQCYLFSSDAQTWTAAEHLCHQQDGELVAIHQTGVMTFLLLNVGDAAYWTGLQNENDTYVWSDGSTTGDIALLLPYMDDWEEGSDCLAISSGDFPTVLKHQPCLSQQRQYVCVKAATAGYHREMYDLVVYPSW